VQQGMKKKEIREKNLLDRGQPVHSMHKNRAMGFVEPRLNLLGKNPGDLWRITTRPHPFAHFAIFPEELAEKCMKAGCPKGGTVLDPFMGSGTVAVVAKRLGMNSVGFELNEEYIKIAERRLAGVKNWGVLKDVDAGVQKVIEVGL